MFSFLVEDEYKDEYKSLFGLAMTLTFDLWPWTPFQQCSHGEYFCQVSLQNEAP